MTAGIGLFDIFPKEILEIIVSYSPSRFWSLNKYFRTLSCHLLNPKPKKYMLLRSSSAGNLDLIKCILQSTNIPFEDIKIALISASEWHVEIVNELLEYKSNEYTGPIHTSILTNPIKHFRVDILDRLLHDPRIDPNDKQFNLFKHILSYRNTDILDCITRHPRVNPGANCNYAIISATLFGNLELVERLLQDDRVDPSVNGNAALKHAIEHNFPKIVDRLLRHQRVIDSDGAQTATYYSLSRNRLEVADMLFRNKHIDPTMHNNYVIMQLYDICRRAPFFQINTYLQNIARPLLTDIMKDKRVNQNDANMKNVNEFLTTWILKEQLCNREETKRRKVLHQ